MDINKKLDMNKNMDSIKHRYTVGGHNYFTKMAAIS